MTVPALTGHLYLRNHRVLVVDDEPLNLQVFDYNFGMDFSLIFANDAEEALAILRDERIAVVIADHRMPGMLGLDLLTWVAENRPETVRVLLTAHTDIPLLLDATNRGVLFRYVPKPWDADTMRQDMMLAIQRHLLEDENLRLKESAKHGGHPPDAVAAALLGDLDPVQARVRASLEAIGRGEIDLGRALAREANGLLDDLAADLRRESDRRLRSLLTLDPNELALAAVASLRSRIASSGTHLETSLCPDLPRVLGSRDGLIEAFSALLCNALDAVEGQSGRRVVVLRTLTAADGSARVEVGDTGPGLSSVARRHATRSFFSSRDRPGLGLAVARAVATAHGGRLLLVDQAVHNDRGGPGATVALELPAWRSN